MNSKLWTFFLPLGLSAFPGLLSSQDAPKNQPFYQKEFGLGQEGPARAETPSKETPSGKSKKNQAKPGLKTEEGPPGRTPPSQTQNGSPGSAPARDPVPQGKSPQDLSDRVQKLNQQYQKDLQSLLRQQSGTADEETDLYPESSQSLPRQNKAPRPLDPSFSESGGADRTIGTLHPVGPKSTRDRVIETQLGTSPGTADFQGNGEAPPRNVRTRPDSGEGESNLILTQAQGGYGPQPANQNKQVIRTQPQGRMAQEMPVQSGPTRRPQPTAPRMAPETPPSLPTPVDPFQKDLEVLKARYLEDLRQLNLRYQEEAAQLIHGVPLPRNSTTAARTVTGDTAAIPGKSRSIWDFFWGPRMMNGYFKPTLPFARMSPTPPASRTQPAETRVAANPNPPVKQTSFFPSLAQPETRKPSSKPQPQPVTRYPSRQEYEAPNQGAPYQETMVPDQRYPAQERQMAPNRAPANYPNPPSAPRQTGYHAPAQGLPRTQPQGYQQGPEFAEYPVQPANGANLPQERAIYPEGPEQMPPGAPVGPATRENLQKALDDLHRRYQEELKALINQPSAPPRPEDQVRSTEPREDRGPQEIPTTRPRDTSVGGRKPLNENQRRSAEEFLEMLQANTQPRSQWTRGKSSEGETAPIAQGGAPRSPKRAETGAEGPLPRGTDHRD